MSKELLAEINDKVQDMNGPPKSLEDHVANPISEEFKNPTMYQEEELEAPNIEDQTHKIFIT